MDRIVTPPPPPPSRGRKLSVMPQNFPPSAGGVRGGKNEQTDTVVVPLRIYRRRKHVEV
jgi:hypothetical protein